MPLSTFSRVAICTLMVVSSLVASSTGALANTLIDEAAHFEARGNYRSAVASYQQYLSDNPKKSAETRLARIKLPVLQETVRYGLDTEVVPFLAALDARAIGLTEEALTLLQQMIDTYPGGHLIDDAIFMSAYVSMMDQYDFAKTRQTLQQLINNYPDSPYVDTSLYSIAIAQEQLGEVDAAITTLTQLRDRHDSLSIAGLSWSKDSYLSRFWFERANNRLQHLHDHLEKAARLISIEAAGSNGYQHQAVVQSDGREFILLLNESQLSNSLNIVNQQGSPLAPTSAKTYEGKVSGLDSSWVRISLMDGDLRGLISMQNEQVRLQPRTTGGSLADFHPLLLGDNDGNRATEQDQVLYPPPHRQSNIGNSSSGGATGLDIGGLETNLSGTDRQIMASDTNPASAVSKVARIGVVVDSKFNNYFAKRGVEEALSILNSTDGIFRQQIGLALSVAQVILIEDTESDPMNLGSVTMETMMRNFREYRMDNEELSSEIGLATLFSGNKNSDTALGLAWIGSACRTDGFDVSVVSPYYLAELLSTHEIGHTLGAPHDSDTACANQTQNIMWPYLSTNTKQQFSSCSKDSVESLLANSSCHFDAIDLKLDLDPISDTEIRISVTNLDQRLTASGVQVVIEADAALSSAPTNCFRQSSSKYVCTVGSMRPSETIALRVDLSEPLTSTDTLQARVSLTNAMDVETSNNAIELDANGNLTSVNSTVSESTYDQFSQAPPSASGGNSSVGSMSPLSYMILLLIAVLFRRPPKSEAFSDTKLLREVIKQSN